MEKLLKQFPHATKRGYKNGIEIRVKDLDASIAKARRLIQEQQLNIEVFDISPQLRSFAVRTKID